MVARRHIEFARANKNSGLLTRRDREIPRFLFEWIRSRDESSRAGIVLRSNTPENLGGFRSCGDTTVGGGYDAQKSGETSRIGQLLCDLVQAGFFQCDRDRPFCFVTLGQRAFGRTKIAAQQEENRTLLFNGVFRSSMNRAVCARSERMKIYRRMNPRFRRD